MNFECIAAITPALHQKLAREYYEGIGTGDKIWGIGLLTGLSMLGGYVRMTARDLAYGDQPRTPKNVGDAFKIGGAAIAQGGGLGLLGDYLFGEINRLGAGAASAGGPGRAGVNRRRTALRNLQPLDAIHWRRQAPTG